MSAGRPGDMRDRMDNQPLSAEEAREQFQVFLDILIIENRFPTATVFIMFEVFMYMYFL